ncbi:DUF5819 family protein [Streptomyces sp. NPDC054842]
MDAYDEGSDARHGPDRPGSPVPPSPGDPVPPSPGGDPVPLPAAGSVPASPASSAPHPPSSSGPPDSSGPPGGSVPSPSGEPARPDDSGPGPRDPALTRAAAEGGASLSGGPDQGPSGPDATPARTGSARTAPVIWPDSVERPAAAPDRAGLAALSLPYRIAAAVALAFVMVAACLHLGMVFLHVAPSNTATKQHGRAVEDWIYPEFEQNWKLFAPNPLQQNIAVQVRAEVRTADGGRRTTGWYDLSARDGEAIDGNPLPSHTQQNELRRAWDFFLASHDSENRPAGLRGDLSERYLRRIVVLRLDRERADADGGVVERVQVRSRTTNVPPPDWSAEPVSDKPVFRVLPWWRVPTGAGASA